MALFEAWTPPGKPAWAPVLTYTARLHARSVRPAQPPFADEWEEIGPGYCYGPAFGHWDIIHQIMDVIDDEPAHARRQFLNNLHQMTADGFLPGSIWLRNDTARGYQWHESVTHPPVWPVALDALQAHEQDHALLERGLGWITAQIGWWQRHRAADGQGFFYTDISDKSWESGVDEGIRFDDVPTERGACIDATCHVYWLFDTAARWARDLGRDDEPFASQAARLKQFVQEALWSDETGFFHDIWAQRDPSFRCFAQEGMWPLIVGIATDDQARRVIDENLLEPERFFTAHPLATVAQCDHRFEQRMWRGPAWNSMTWWAALGCRRYHRPDAAAALLAAALDATAEQFDRTGVIWEYYHSERGDQEQVARKPHTPFNTPCKDYLGHNPLIAMARLWSACDKQTAEDRRR